MLGEDVTLELKVQQGPIVVVAAQDDASAIAAVATVGTTVGVIFSMPLVHASSTALSRAAVYLHIVYEIRFCHISCFLFFYILQSYGKKRAFWH